MNLEDLGNIGEFVASIAVVVSLVYLAIQLRRNTQQLASSERALLRTESTSAHDQWSRFRHLLVNNREAAELWIKGQKDYEALDEIEKLQFRHLAVDQLYIINNMRERHYAGVSEQGLWERNLITARRFVATPGGNSWWAENRGIFLDDLVSDIENEATLDKQE